MRNLVRRGELRSPLRTQNSVFIWEPTQEKTLMNMLWREGCSKAWHFHRQQLVCIGRKDLEVLEHFSHRLHSSRVLHSRVVLKEMAMAVASVKIVTFIRVGSC